MKNGKNQIDGKLNISELLSAKSTKKLGEHNEDAANIEFNKNTCEKQRKTPGRHAGKDGLRDYKVLVSLTKKEKKMFEKAMIDSGDTLQIATFIRVRALMSVKS